MPEPEYAPVTGLQLYYEVHGSGDVYLNPDAGHREDLAP